MRAIVGAIVFALSSCGGSEPLGTPCTVSTNCGSGLICVDGNCVSAPGGLPIGEGEGEGGKGGEGEGIPKGDGEGEGDVASFGEGEGEGNGQSGEGEGSAGEGEGASVGEGEGEGAAGEGEGEGPPPSCPPDDCGAFMTCVADNSCDPGTNSPCDAFTFNPLDFSNTPAVIDFFADQTSTSSPPAIIDDINGTRFDFSVDLGNNNAESFDSFWLTRATSLIRKNMFVHYEVASALDTVLIALDPSGGTCGIVPNAFSDSFVAGGTESFDINYATTPTSLLIGVGTCDGVDGQNCVAGSPNDASRTTGDIELRANGILCPTAVLGANAGPAADDITNSQNTYDFCFRALFETAGTSNTCANSNPCERVAGGKLNGSFCNLNANAGHTHGSPITTTQDLNVCCSTDHTKNVAPCPTG
jgi:hypothetical protein